MYYTAENLPYKHTQVTRVNIHKSIKLQWIRKIYIDKGSPFSPDKLSKSYLRLAGQGRRGISMSTVQCGIRQVPVRWIDGSGMPRQKMKIDGRRKIIDHIINSGKGNLTLVTQSKYKNLTLKDSVNEFKLGEKFDCQNSDTILDHMNGEWAKRNNSAVSGGHLLKGMEDKWGKAENAPAVDNDITKRGIYFTNDKPNINKVTHNIYTL